MEIERKSKVMRIIGGKLHEIENASGKVMICCDFVL